MDATPIACTLTRAELTERLGEVEALGRDALLGSERGERSVALWFRPGAETAARIEAFAAAESRCCAFLSFEVARKADATLLTIKTPPGGEQILGELADRFEPAADAGSRRVST